MFKKILLFTFLILPLLFIFIGYPITPSKNTRYHNSQRCFAVGDMHTTFSCSSNMLKGVNLLQHIFDEVDDVQQGFGTLLVIMVFGELMLLIFIL